MRQNDYTDISFNGTTGQTAKTMFTLGSAANDIGKTPIVQVYDITVSNQTGTGGIVKIFSNIGTAGDDIEIYASATQTVVVRREIPFDWHLVTGTSGFKQYVYASSFPGAGVKTYIGAILQ